MLFNRPVPFYTVLIALAAGGAGAALIGRNVFATKTAQAGTSIAATNTGNPSDDYVFTHISAPGRYHFINPLLSVERENESAELQGVKASIASLADNYKSAGKVTDISVYLKTLNKGNWIAYNPDLQFHPGSLIKVALMIAYLHHAEQQPSMLDKEIVYDARFHDKALPEQTYNGKEIEAGHKYSVKQLLHYMIAYSDNHATKMLMDQVDQPSFKRAFSELGFGEPDLYSGNYEVTARRYAAFFGALYHATYLSYDMSDYACSLLSEGDFKDGITKFLPADVKVLHKFGEWGNQAAGTHELHECGIVLLNNNPYILTIMTKGTKVSDLADVISMISRTVYENESAKGASTAAR